MRTTTAAACLVLLALAAPARAAIDVSGLALAPGDVLTLTAVDPAAPISGVAVDFGAGEDRIALSACGRGAGDPGEPRAFQIPHEYASLLPRVVTVTVFSGGCSAPPDSVERVVLVTPAGNSLIPDVGGLLGGGAARAAQRCADVDLVPDEDTLARAAAATRCLVNERRTARGLVALKGRKKLRLAATRHVRDMVEHGYFAHARPGGPSLFERLRAARFRFAFAGENIGAGTGTLATPAEIVQQWMLSPPHRENMLLPGFRQQGVGVAIGFPLAGLDEGATYALELAKARRRR